MALVKFGSVITDAAGKIGGVCYQRKKASSRVRASTHKRIKDTQASIRIRSQFAQLVNYFKYTLTASEQASWLEFALQHPMKNSFGDARILSPMAAFIRQNKILLWWDKPIITSAPNPIVFPSDIIFAGYKFRATPPLLRWVLEPIAFPVDYILFGYTTGPLSPGSAHSFRRTLHLVINRVVGVERNFRWQTEWEENFGPLQGGMCIGYSANIVHVPTGFTKEIQAGGELVTAV